MDSLKDQRIAILVTKGFEQVELTEPKKALDQAGARTDIVSPDAGRMRALTGWTTRWWLTRAWSPAGGRITYRRSIAR